MSSVVEIILSFLEGLCVVYSSDILKYAVDIGGNCEG
jgi:hypothetical protein